MALGQSGTENKQMFEISLGKKTHKQKGFMNPICRLLEISTDKKGQFPEFPHLVSGRHPIGYAGQNARK